MQPSPLLDLLNRYAQAWADDAHRLRKTGAQKNCDKCVVAAEVYDECATQLRDILAHLPVVTDATLPE